MWIVTWVSWWAEIVLWQPWVWWEKLFWRNCSPWANNVPCPPLQNVSESILATWLLCYHHRKNGLNLANVECATYHVKTTSWFEQTNKGRATVAKVTGQSLGPCCDPYQTQLQWDGKMHTSLLLHLPKRDDCTFTHPFSLNRTTKLLPRIFRLHQFSSRGNSKSCLGHRPR